LPKLVLNVALGADLAGGGTAVFPCNNAEAPEFAQHIGEQILIADIGHVVGPRFIALARLAGFEGDVSARRAVMTDILEFPEPLDLAGPEAELGRMAELDDAMFQAIIEAVSTGEAPVVSGYVREAAAPFAAQEHLALEFRRQLEGERRRRCSFSDVETRRGDAWIIRPIRQGGTLHIRNCLYLDPEPGVLFQKFAWTVGPQFQIIIDAQAMGTGVAETVNRLGMLALGDDISRWPDRAALDWHFEEFCRRRRSA
jgi:hypothetical protein